MCGERLCQVALLLAVFTGCSMHDPGIPAVDYEAEGARGVAIFVARHVEYASDPEQYGTRDYWASPEETFASGRGDCEDSAILMMYLLRRDLGLDSWLVIVETAEGYHALVLVDGELWDPNRIARDNYRTYTRRLPYSLVMRSLGRHPT